MPINNQNNAPIGALSTPNNNTQTSPQPGNQQNSRSALNTTNAIVGPQTNPGTQATTATQVQTSTNWLPLKPEWSQTISAGATITIGIAATTVAFYNVWTARRKLKLDFYKPRYEIYEAILGFLDLVIKSEMPIESKNYYEFLAKTNVVAWLFESDKRLTDFIGEIQRLVLLRQAVQAALKTIAANTTEYDKKLEELQGIDVKLQDMRDKDLNKLFKKHLSV